MKARREFLTQVAAAGALVATLPFAEAVAAADVVETVLGPLAAAKLGFTLTDDSGDPDYFIGLCKRGYTLNMDHMNYGLAPNATLPWQKRADNIKRLIDPGFAQHLLFSRDSLVSSSLLPEEHATSANSATRTVCCSTYAS